MKDSVIKKASTWLRFIAFMAIILSIAACDSGSLPGGNNDNSGSNPSSLDEIRLNSVSLTLLVGGTETLTATILPADAANKAVSWNSADSKIASVDPSKGTVTAIAVGKTVITAKTNNGKTASCSVSVTDASTAIEPTGVALFPPTLTLDIGGTDTLAVTVTPSNAAKNVNWKSSNPAVVVVDQDGKITAMDAGTATVYALTVVGGKQASSVITVNSPPLDVEPINKYEVKGETGNNINDRIKYSVSYGDLDYYYIYLGRMRHIPLFSYATYLHNGITHTYTVATTKTEKETIETAVTKSSATTLGLVDTNTVSTTLGGKLSAEISAKYTTNAKLGGDSLGGSVSVGTEVGAKTAVEAYWSNVKTDSSSISTQKTTSLADTIKRGSEYTFTTQETRSWNLTKSDKNGSYRYTMFSTSDVYLYVIRDRNKPKEIYYEFREHVINDPDFYTWALDYSEDGSFNKTDETRFNFNVSMLDNLPKPKSDIAPSFEITFNTNGGSSVSKQTVALNGTVTKPTDPTRSGYTFGGWYKDAGLQNPYDFTSKVVENTTLYAKWNAVSLLTVTFSVNGGSGTVPTSQTVALDSKITLPSGSGLTKIGYFFNGWNTNTSGTGTNYSAGSSYPVTSSVTLYAKWSSTTYTASQTTNFSIKNGAYNDWKITTSFDIAGLKNAGYTKLALTLNYDGKNELWINIGSRLYASFWKGLAPSVTTKYLEDYVVWEDNKWHTNKLTGSVNLSDFANQLTIRFGTSGNASYTVGTRGITIEAKK